ncbi:MAG: ABC transporter substrate-binding protein [Nitrospirae bacterium]|nr:ABC transporter substrate-binding protein [Nitrospirota bacterium]
MSGLANRAETRRIVLTISFILVLSLAACTSNDRIAGYIHYRINYNPTTLDPALIVDVTGGLIAAKIFNGLVRLNEKLEVMPDLAESWSLSPDATTYTFYLRKDARFSNGRSLSAADVKYSFERILDPGGKSPHTWILDKISGAREFMNGKSDEVSGIRVSGPYTIQLVLERPFSPFLNLLTMTAAYVVPKEDVRKWGDDFGTHPVGSGPFCLTQWKHNNHLLLARNADYFGGIAKNMGIRYRIIPEDLTAITEFELGNLDVISVPASEYRRIKNTVAYENLVASIEGINTYYLGFNCSRPPFDNIRARRAVSSAIDRKRILETFYEGRGRLAHGPIPDILRRWEAPAPPDYDPVTAKKLIDAAGLKGKKIQFYITADPEVVDIAEIVQFYLQSAGLSVTIKQLEWSSYKAAINNGEADMFWISWWADYPDPENFLFPLFHSSNHGPSGNRTRYTNKSVDDLIEAGQKSADMKKRDHYYLLAERAIVEDMPWVFFWHKTDITVRQAALRNYRLYPIYSMDKGLEVSF